MVLANEINTFVDSIETNIRVSMEWKTSAACIYNTRFVHIRRVKTDLLENRLSLLNKITYGRQKWLIIGMKQSNFCTVVTFTEAIWRRLSTWILTTFVFLATYVHPMIYVQNLSKVFFWYNHKTTTKRKTCINAFDFSWESLWKFHILINNRPWITTSNYLSIEVFAQFLDHHRDLEGDVRQSRDEKSTLIDEFILKKKTNTISLFNISFFHHHHYHHRQSSAFSRRHVYVNIIQNIFCSHII